MIKDKEEELERMTFWEHLDEFRSVIIRSVSTIALFSVIFFCFMEKIFDNFILAPCSSDFIVYRSLCSLMTRLDIMNSLCDPFQVNLINYNLNAQFFVHLSTAFWLGLIFAFPMILYFLWCFVAPALYSNEKKGIVSAFALGNGIIIHEGGHLVTGLLGKFKFVSFRICNLKLIKEKEKFKIKKGKIWGKEYMQFV